MVDGALAAQRLVDVEVVALDLEMTGLDIERDRICEIGVIYGVGREIHGRWNALVRPDVSMTQEAVAITGLDDAALLSAPPFELLLDDMVRTLEGRVCLAHAAPVDRRFVEVAFARAGRPMPRCVWLDTLALSRNLLALRSHKLGALARGLGVSTRRLHRALADAEATWGVAHALLDLIDPGREITVGEVGALAEVWAVDGPLRQHHAASLAAAIEARQVVHLAYASRDETECWRRTEREVSPWRLRGGRLIGWCHLRQEERVFRLERIHDIRAVPQRDWSFHAVG